MSTHMTKILKVNQSNRIEAQDALAIEEPLEIQMSLDEKPKSISITMRTPGNDFELAAGFLFTEGIIQEPSQVQNISHPKSWNPETEGNIVSIELAKGVTIDFEKLERHFYTSSSCGVCGKTSIDAIRANGLKQINDLSTKCASQIIHQLPDQLRQAQSIFDETGGLHAAALFDMDGKLLFLREDVGRHNAVDKLIGTAFLNKELPLQKQLLMLSGRVSFELVQKAAMAGIPIIAAVGAPSNLAIALAEEVGITVLGFVRDHRFNIYSKPERIV